MDRTNLYGRVRVILRIGGVYTFTVWILLRTATSTGLTDCPTYFYYTLLNIVHKLPFRVLFCVHARWFLNKP